MFPKLSNIPPRELDSIIIGSGNTIDNLLSLGNDGFLSKLPWLFFGSGTDGTERGTLVTTEGSKAFLLRGEISKLRVDCPCQCLSHIAYALPQYVSRDTDARYNVGTFLRWDDVSVRTPHTHTAMVESDGPGDFLKLVKLIWKYRNIRTESLTVAVIADAYGIPWQPLRWSDAWADCFGSEFQSKPSGYVLSDAMNIRRRQDDIELARQALTNYVDSQE